MFHISLGRVSSAVVYQHPTGTSRTFSLVWVHCPSPVSGWDIGNKGPLLVLQPFCSWVLPAQLFQWHVLPWLIQHMVSVGGTDLVWDVPCWHACCRVPVQLLVSAHQPSALGSPCYCWSYAPGDAAPPAAQAVEALGHRDGRSLANASGSCKSQFPQDRSYLLTVCFSSLGKLFHSLKFIFFPGRMLQDEKQSYLPCVTPLSKPLALALLLSLPFNV